MIKREFTVCLPRTRRCHSEGGATQHSPPRLILAPTEESTVCCRVASRRAVASRHHGEYRGFFGRHLSRRGRLEPAESTPSARLLRTSGTRGKPTRRAGAVGPRFPRCPGPSREPRVCEIAHQVIVGAGSCAAPADTTGTDGPLEKTRMAPCRASIPLPFQMVRAGSCLVDRHAVPSAGTKRMRGGATCSDTGETPKCSRCGKTAQTVRTGASMRRWARMESAARRPDSSVSPTETPDR
jgi:hypothetical protein